MLGVPLDADARTVKSAWRKHALRHHPDRGGDPEEFTRGCHAYDVFACSGEEGWTKADLEDIGRLLVAVRQRQWLDVGLLLAVMFLQLVRGHVA